MLPFKAPLEDILFSLEQVAGAVKLSEYDADLHREIADHFAAFAEGVLAPLNRLGDINGAQLENGRVRMPEGFKDAYKQFCEQGWPALTASEAHGGQGLGGTALGITSEIFTGANHAMEMICGLVPGAIRTLVAFGSSEQQNKYIPLLASGQWLATMALTEPGAGSDLSRIKCQAVQKDGNWFLGGEKIFISGGDQDLSNGILHFVLARTSKDGLAGLSLFLCCTEGSDGLRNSLEVTRIEEKLGIHASPTCQLHFNGAEAHLIGGEGQGLLAMFEMMNHMRIAVALQGVAHAARATQIAKAYAAERIQGKGAVIAEHPDVRRMLDEMDMRAIGARGIAHLALVKLESGKDADLAELLTPVAKYFCTEVASEAADQGIQVLGGYGYLEEYGMAQILRDTRICRIYEGANGIHALSLATRLKRKNTPLEAFDEFAAQASDISKAHEDWRRVWQDVQSLADARPVADAFMRVTAELLHQIVWNRIKHKAHEHSDPLRLTRLARRAEARWRLQIEHYNASRELSK